MQVFALASDPVRLTSVLVVGSQRALLVDTGAGPGQAVRLLAAVRQITDLPLVVANTHDHWDHFFGNATFAEAGVTQFFGSPAFVRDSPGSAWLQHAEASEHELDLPGPESLAVPVEPLVDGAVIELGPVEVVEALVATGHTDTDLVLRAGPILIVGDLLEEGAPPQVGLDASPVAWVQTLERLLALESVQVFVPGHGRPVGRGFVEAQRTDLAAYAASADADEAEAVAHPPARTSTLDAAVPGTPAQGTVLTGVRVTRIL